MSFNKKYVILGLVILSLLWTGNIVFYNKYQLKAPIFIKNYYDIKRGIPSFDLYYIENINAKDKVVSITFPELGQQQYLNCNKMQCNTDGRYYSLNAIRIENFYGYMNDENNELKNKIITKGHITFESGKTMDVPLGKIYLNSDTTNGKDLKQISVSSSSDYTGGTVFSATKDLKVVGISGKFYDELKDILKININGKELSENTFPISLKSGESINISYSFKLKEKDLRSYNAYDFYIDLLTEDMSGKKDSGSIFVNFHCQSPEYYDIETLKKNRGWQ